jgi:DNA-binding XRE family transcriptional regulator
LVNKKGEIKISTVEYKSLKEVRQSFNKTQKEVAKAIYISDSYYNLIENGKRCPAIDLAADLSRELGLSLDNFFKLYCDAKYKA